MSNTLVELKSAEDLDRLVEASVSHPVVLYKHSLTCGTSAMAFEEIRDLVTGPPVGASIGVVMVQPSRALSNEIAARFGVRHESPQVLIVHNRRVQWQASHFRVTAAAITAALQQLAPSTVP